MLLPLASKYQAGYIKGSLRQIRCPETSHSRVQNDFIRRQNDLLDIWTHTILKLSTLNDSDKLRNLFDAYDYYEQTKRAATAKPASTTQTIWIFEAAFRFSQSKTQEYHEDKIAQIYPFYKNTLTKLFGTCLNQTSFPGRAAPLIRHIIYCKTIS